MAGLPTDYSGRVQIQRNQFPGDFQQISSIQFFKIPEIFLHDKPYSIKMQVK